MLYCFSQNRSNYHVNGRTQSSFVNVWNVRAQQLNVLISMLFCTPTFRKCRISKTLLLRPINSNLKRMLKSWFYQFYPSRNPSELAPASVARVRVPQSVYSGTSRRMPACPSSRWERPFWKMCVLGAVAGSSSRPWSWLV